jgi:hypothetical protein
MMTYVMSYRFMMYLKYNNCGCVENNKSWILRNLSLPLLGLSLIIHSSSLYSLYVMKTFNNIFLNLLIFVNAVIFISYVYSLYFYLREIDNKNCECLNKLPQLYTFLKRSGLAIVIVLFSFIIMPILMGIYFILNPSKLNLNTQQTVNNNMIKKTSSKKK